MISATVQAAAAAEYLWRRRHALRARLGDAFVDAAQALLAGVRAKLSGPVLQPRTGALRASVQAALVEDAQGFEARVWSGGNVPYARIQEYGGRIAIPEIRAVRATALAFAYRGRIVFAKRVRAHTVTIPERSFLRSALQEFAPAFVQSVARIANGP